MSKMKANISLTKTCFLFKYIVFALGILNCGAVGGHRPQWGSRMLSPNGNYFVLILRTSLVLKQSGGHLISKATLNMIEHGKKTFEKYECNSPLQLGKTEIDKLETAVKHQKL